MESKQPSQLIIFPDPRIQIWKMEQTMGKSEKIIYYHQVMKKVWLWKCLFIYISSQTILSVALS